ncbi:MAG: precorrin-2 C(20)-methyltransferase [Alphaproteobacteria bacterium]
MIKKTKAICYGIGVGPGGHEGITLAAVTLLKKINIIVVFCKKGMPSRSKKIAQPFLGKRKHITFINYPLVMAPRHTNNLVAYEKLIPHITKYLDDGKNVAVLCEGDPLFYGSFQYVMQLLPEKYTTKIIPAVTSPHMASAKSKISLGLGKDNLCFISAASDSKNIINLLKTTDKAVIIKLGSSFKKIKSILKKLNLIDNATLCIELNRADEKILQLKNWQGDTVPYFSLIIIDKKKHKNNV